MKKYLLIPMFFIAAFATSYAGCGACGGQGDHDHAKEKAECAEKCEKECKKECKKKCCSEGESCCKKSKDSAKK